MSKIAAGRAGWSANTFSEGGFGGQGLPDAQFTSTPALSITKEFVSTTDSGWGDFAWGEHEWGHPEAKPRTHVTFITASATGSLIADFEASDAVQFTTTSASLFGLETVHPVQTNITVKPFCKDIRQKVETCWYCLVSFSMSLQCSMIGQGA